jgi:hypothetical protein
LQYFGLLESVPQRMPGSGGGPASTPPLLEPLPLPLLEPDPLLPLPLLLPDPPLLPDPLLLPLPDPLLPLLEPDPLPLDPLLLDPLPLDPLPDPLPPDPLPDDAPPSPPDAKRVDVVAPPQAGRSNAVTATTASGPTSFEARIDLLLTSDRSCNPGSSSCSSSTSRSPGTGSRRRTSPSARWRPCSSPARRT